MGSLVKCVFGPRLFRIHSVEGAQVRVWGPGLGGVWGSAGGVYNGPGATAGERRAARGAECRGVFPSARPWAWGASCRAHM